MTMNANTLSECRRLGFYEALALCLKLALCLAGLALLACCHGCATDPATGDTTITIPAAAWDAATNAAARAAVAIREARDASAVPADPAAAPNPDGGAAEGRDPATTPQTPAVGSEPATSSVVLDFRYGGFDGSAAKEDARCVLGSPKITQANISYKWESGIPSDWKRFTTSKGPMVVACAFYWDDGKWVGGKMDWTDENRTSRACDHIHDGYNGWKADGWDAAKERAFCVVSADGKFRSNLITD